MLTRLGMRLRLPTAQLNVSEGGWCSIRGLFAYCTMMACRLPPYFDRRLHVRLRLRLLRSWWQQWRSAWE